MKKAAVILIATLLFSNLSLSQKIDDYAKLWNEVNQYELQSLPKSALKTVETIYNKAQNENNSTQVVRALMFKSKFALTLEENAQLKVINQFKTEIEKANAPTKNILESILANLYWQYFQQNRWKFYNRTNIAEKVAIEDFRTWDLPTLFSEIHLHFQNSLQNKKLLQQTNLEVFNDILELKKDSKTYRPTLYDFMAHNALSFYKTPENSITKPADKFEVSQMDFERFYLTGLKYSEKRKQVSLQYEALKLYQQLIAFHHKKRTPMPLLLPN